MILSVEHSTVYRYNCTVILDTHTLRLRPRMTTTQRLLGFDLQVVPAPMSFAESLDQDGNLACLAWFNTPTSELRVTSRFRVELMRSNPFDFNLRVESQNLALAYTPLLAAALSVYRKVDHLDENVKQFAMAIAVEANWNLLSFLTTLNRRIFDQFRHITRPEGSAWPSGQTLSSLTGSCRDLAVVFCDACRSIGIAARFVSGYEIASAGETNAEMHAWAEVYLPDAGWRGYDPSRGLAVANSHIAVAAAFDPELAAPITGLFSGSCQSQMETRLNLRVATHDFSDGSSANRSG